MRGTTRDRVLLTGVALVVAAAAVPRFVHLGAGLPTLVAPDEPTVVDRAVALARHGRWPSAFDWPPLAMELLAVAMRATGRIGDYLFARYVFVAIALAVVALAGALGAALAGDDRRHRRIGAWTAAGLVAVSYVSVRISRQAQPDHLQMGLVAASFLCTLRYDRTRDRRWLVGAGALAGLAGATKYLGALVVLCALAATGLHRDRRGAGALMVAALLGFLAGAPSALWHAGAFRDGLAYQFGHQASQGHLGYDAAGGQWWFHLSRSLPGNWGWPATVLAVAGVAAAALRGSRPQRLALVFVVPTFALVGASRVRFPHYVLVLLPFLAALAGAAFARLTARLPPAVLLTALALTLVPTALDDVRLVRAAASPDTRLAATARLASLGPVAAVTERYGVLDHAALVPTLGADPSVLDCACVVVISSYQEERFRREPARYRHEVAVYDALRARGRVLAVIRPRRHLPYDWDLLPQWGLRRIPLTGTIGPVGPTVTLLDLRPRR